jgi:hypothetical protein
MQLIKRNSNEFKTVRSIVEDYETLSARKKLIRLFSLKPYESLDKRVSINDRGKGSAVIYNLAYEGLLDYLRFNKSKKLYREDKEAIYFFKSSPSAKWLEFPFELRGKLKKQVFPLTKLK